MTATKKILASFLSLVVLTVFAMPTLAFAQEGTIFQNLFGGLKTSIGEAYLGMGDLPDGAIPGGDPFLFVLVGILNQLLTFVGIIFFLLIVYAGYLWLMARGSEDQIGKAKKMLREAIIGLLIILLARIITEFILAQLQKVTTQLPTA